MFEQAANAREWGQPKRSSRMRQGGIGADAEDLRPGQRATNESMRMQSETRGPTLQFGLPSRPPSAPPPLPVAARLPPFSSLCCSPRLLRPCLLLSSSTPSVFFFNLESGSNAEARPSRCETNSAGKGQETKARTCGAPMARGACQGAGTRTRYPSRGATGAQWAHLLISGPLELKVRAFIPQNPVP